MTLSPVSITDNYFARENRRFIPIGAHWVPAKTGLQWPLQWDETDIEADFAKMLDLGYPGGPRIDEMARTGNPEAIRFPRAYLDPRGWEFSFSGVKTAVLYHLRKHGRPGDAAGLADLCASFQEAVVETLVEKTRNAARHLGVRDVTIAGGVSANSRLRQRMQEACRQSGLRLFYPPLEYCMDNGAMIGYVGWRKLEEGLRSPLELNAAAGLELV